MLSFKSLYTLSHLIRRLYHSKLKKNIKSNQILPIKSFRIKRKMVFPYFIVAFYRIYWDGNSITFFEFGSIDCVVFVHFLVSMVAMLGKEVYQYVKLFFTVRSDIKHKKKKYCVMYNLCIGEDSELSIITSLGSLFICFSFV